MITIIYNCKKTAYITELSLGYLGSASTQVFFDNYLNNSQGQSAETPKYQMMGPVKGHEASAIEG